MDNRGAGGRRKRREEAEKKEKGGKERERDCLLLLFIPLTEDIEKTDLFMYSYYYFGFNPEIMELNNWFIHSCTNNNILCLLQKLLFSYWKDYDHAANYYIYQIFQTIVNEYYEKEYADMPIISQAQAHVLAIYIYDDFDPVKYEVLKKTTGIHKLSTRFDADKISKKGTFYDVVINQANN